MYMNKVERTWIENNEGHDISGTFGKVRDLTAVRQLPGG